MLENRANKNMCDLFVIMRRVSRSHNVEQAKERTVLIKKVNKQITQGKSHIPKETWLKQDKRDLSEQIHLRQAPHVFFLLIFDINYKLHLVRLIFLVLDSKCFYYVVSAAESSSETCPNRDSLK